MSGGGSCSSCGSALNSNTFKNHINNLEHELSGGGYSVNRLGQNIANRAVIHPYTDTNPLQQIKGNQLLVDNRSYCGQMVDKVI